MKKRIFIAGVILTLGLCGGCSNGGAENETVATEQTETAAPEIDNKGKYQEAKDIYDIGKYDVALEKFKELGEYEEAPLYVEMCYFQMASQKLIEGNYQEAETLISNVVSIDTTELRNILNYQKGTALYNSGSVAEGIELIKANPYYEDTVDYLNSYAKKLLKEKKYDEVVTLLNDCRDNETSVELIKKAQLKKKYKRLTDNIGTVNWGDHYFETEIERIEASLQDFVYGRKFSYENDENVLEIDEQYINGKEYGVYAYCCLDRDELLIYYHFDKPKKLYALCSGPYFGSGYQEVIDLGVLRSWYWNDFSSMINGKGPEDTFYNVKADEVDKAWALDEIEAENARREAEERDRKKAQEDNCKNTMYNLAKSSFKNKIKEGLPISETVGWIYSYPSMNEISITYDEGAQSYTISFQVTVYRKIFGPAYNYSVNAVYKVINGQVNEVSFIVG